MQRLTTVLTLMTLIILALLMANQTLLLAKPSVTAAETMVTANRLYETGDFNLAAQGYQQLVDQGFADSTLYYNLGNAYFKQGDYGRAILNYRRAELLAPRDDDIQANLSLARSRVVDQLEEVDPEESVLSGIGAWTQQWLSLDELAGLVLGIWVFFVVLVLLFSNSRKGSARREGWQYLLLVTGLVLVIGIVGLGSRIYLESAQSEAVVLAEKVEVTSGPGPQYVTEFTLHSGAEIEHLEIRGRWSRLAVGGGELQGWVPASTIEAVN